MTMLRTLLFYTADAFFLASLATIILKLKIEKSHRGFSAKSQGLYVVIFLTRYLHILFDSYDGLYQFTNLTLKLLFIFTSIYIVITIRNMPEKEGCTCNEDSFWVEAWVIMVILFTIVAHRGHSPEWILWSFSMYLEVGAMLPQFYLIHERGKGDTFVGAYITFMACYSLFVSTSYTISYFGTRDPDYPQDSEVTWTICKLVQLLLYFWYFLTPKKPVLPTMTCEQRRRRPTLFRRQESMLAHSLLNKKKSNPLYNLQIFIIGQNQDSPVLKKKILSTPKPACTGSPVSLRTIRFFGEFNEPREVPGSNGSSIPSTPNTASSDHPLEFHVNQMKY